MQVDVGAVADVAGERAADQPRAKGPQQAHHAAGLRSRMSRRLSVPPLALVEPGQDLNLVADFAIAGEICAA